jgi:hypothetical protein
MRSSFLLITRFFFASYCIVNWCESAIASDASYSRRAVQDPGPLLLPGFLLSRIYLKKTKKKCTV